MGFYFRRQCVVKLHPGYLPHHMTNALIMGPENEPPFGPVMIQLF